MTQPNLEKLDRLYKYRHGLKETAQSVGGDLNISRDKITNLEASLLHLDRHSNEAASIREEIVELGEERAKFQLLYSKISDDIGATIALINNCEAYLESQGIPVPDDVHSARSTSFYRR